MIADVVNRVAPQAGSAPRKALRVRWLYATPKSRRSADER